MTVGDASKIKKIGKLLAGHVADVFLYFLFLYLFIFAMSFFFDLWQAFWVKPMLHISLLIFGLVYLLERKIRTTGVSDSISFFKKIFKKITGAVYGKIAVVWSIKNIFRSENRLKLLELGRFLGLSLHNYFKKTGLFCREVIKHLLGRIRAGGLITFFSFWSLFFLLFCPFLSYFKNVALAEKSAIYAYYSLFVTITLIIVENIINARRSKSR